MISSSEGLEMFRNWQKRNALLHLSSSGTSALSAGRHTVRVEQVSRPPEIPFVALAGDGLRLELTLTDAEFEKGGLGIPADTGILAPYIPSLEVRLSDGRFLVFREDTDE
jgi:hypothetical protein